MSLLVQYHEAPILSFIDMPYVTTLLSFAELRRTKEPVSQRIRRTHTYTVYVCSRLKTEAAYIYMYIRIQCAKS